MGSGRDTIAPMRALTALGLLAVVLVAVVLGLLGERVYEGRLQRTTPDGRSYVVRSADVLLVIGADGTMRVRERIGIDFDGSFRGAFRRIELAPGERLVNTSVRDDTGRRYEPTGTTALGRDDRPGRFGLSFDGERVVPSAAEVSERVVATTPSARSGGTWDIVLHHDRSSHATFEISYTVVGRVRSTPSASLVAWTLWSRQWSAGVERLRAEIRLPDDVDPREVSVGPRSSKASSRIDGNTVIVTASALPAGRPLDVAVATDAPIVGVGSLAATGDVVKGVRERASRDRSVPVPDRVDTVLSSLPVLVPIAAVLSWLLAGGMIAMWRRRIREPEIVREHAHAPPDTPISRGSVVLGEGAHLYGVPARMSATIADLIARGYFEYEAEAVDGRWQLVVGFPHARPSERLHPSEWATVQLLDALLLSGPASLDELAESVADHAEAARLVRAGVGQVSPVVGDRVRSRSLPARASAVLIGSLPLVGLAALAHDAYGRTTVDTWVPWAMIGLAVATVLTAVMRVPRGAFTRSTGEAQQSLAHWRAYRDWVIALGGGLAQPPALDERAWARVWASGVLFGVDVPGLSIIATALADGDEPTMAAWVNAAEALERLSGAIASAPSPEPLHAVGDDRRATV